MRYSFTGKDSVLSDAIKEKAINKISKVEKFLPEDTDAVINLSVVKLTHKIEVTIPFGKRILRAEAVDVDMYAAIDKVVDVLEKQLVKHKSRLRDKSRREPSYKDEFNKLSVDEKYLTDQSISIEKTKRFALKPMDSEEAVLEMELLGHNFFVFRNSHSEDINVVYKRNNGTYGLIEPEF